MKFQKSDDKTDGGLKVHWMIINGKTSDRWGLIVGDTWARVCLFEKNGRGMFVSRGTYRKFRRDTIDEQWESMFEPDVVSKWDFPASDELCLKYLNEGIE